MAGGRGERFWPRSRMAKPKQFLNLIGKKTMLQLTVERIQGLVGISDTYIVAGLEFKDTIMEQVPELPEENIIIEPFGRDTAAAIGLAALTLGRKNPREVMIVLPADHYIGNVRNFQEVLRSAVAVAAKGEKIITLGITPHSPETGYGYINCGQLADTIAGIPAYRAVRFLEKPDYARALELLSSGDYLWNSGMFVWRIDMIRKKIEKHIPSLAEGLKEIESSLGTDRYPKKIDKVYSELPKVSIDYGIMERADNVLVIPCDFGWDDIGNWNALEKYDEKDELGNVLHGQGVLLDTLNTYIISNKTVALLGVKNLIIVNDHDSLLICHKSRTQEIKKVVQALSDKGFNSVL
ncbi:MAG: mannose-1-phosphate guanylyltransferase [Peptococcaceae bacterium BRH_c4a]|nr:MAG: mannose-1-phosphate guanylyltransferase [Peptococcaceae bacterium BRH_c4a]